MRPHSAAFLSAKVLTVSSIFRRAATPFCCSCRKASCAAAQASWASWNTPNLPRRPVLVLPCAWPLQLQGLAGAGAGGTEFTDAAPPRRPRTSLTTSRTRASLMLFMGRLSGLFVAHCDLEPNPLSHAFVSALFRVWAFGFSGLLPRAVNLFSQHIHRINNADNDGIDGGISKTGCQPGAAALAENHQFTHAGANTVH